jgi:hypothetical protein
MSKRWHWAQIALNVLTAILATIVLAKERGWL